MTMPLSRFLALILIVAVSTAVGAARLGAVQGDDAEAAISWLQELVQDDSKYDQDELKETLSQLKDKVEAQQQQQQQQESRQLFWPKFFQSSAGNRTFGETCNTRKTCRTGMECTGTLPVGIDRCLPNDCLEASDILPKLSNSLDKFKDQVILDAGLTQSDLLWALTRAGARQFGQTKEFQSLKGAMHSNKLTFKDQLIQLRQECVDDTPDITNEEKKGPRNFDDETTIAANITYMGLHLELGVLSDVSFSYLMATNGNETQDKNLIRYCFGVEAGAGAEISGLFGFTDTPTMESLTDDVTVFGDADIVMIIAAGAATACGMKDTFMYEFTAGGGAGLGLGGGGVCYTVEDTGNAGTAGNSTTTGSGGGGFPGGI